jgi:hypothetical protein
MMFRPSDIPSCVGMSVSLNPPIWLEKHKTNIKMMPVTESAFSFVCFVFSDQGDRPIIPAEMNLVTGTIQLKDNIWLP